MDAHDLFRLGRHLTRIAEEAMRSDGAPKTPPGVRLILTDIRDNPGSAIGEIAARTGLPQSYASESVARLRDQGALETWNDPDDRRRTRVRIAADVPRAVARAGAVRIDEALLAAAGTGDPTADRALIEQLAALAARLNTR
ncbi:MarR family winged helix-turn-helix transcriptional regulator [Actinophytocola sp.]|uniref:MarR family winged helix-turn-helix transcriptional regulator n=1 Tax=Actinophytocola sp. TaxID=1872138 RepID=UPI00389A8876